MGITVRGKKFQDGRTVNMCLKNQRFRSGTVSGESNSDALGK